MWTPPLHRFGGFLLWEADRGSGVQLNELKGDLDIRRGGREEHKVKDNIVIGDFRFYAETKQKKKVGYKAVELKRGNAVRKGEWEELGMR